MAVDCEITNCGVIAAGRCIYCGRAFCLSHRSALLPGCYGGTPWPYGAVINACSECQRNAIDADKERAQEAIRKDEIETDRLAALPQMSLRTLTEYIRSRADNPLEFNGERLGTFLSREVADAMRHAGRSPQLITYTDRGFMNRKKTGQGWLFRISRSSDDRLSRSTYYYLLPDGNVQRCVAGRTGELDVRPLTGAEIAALSAERPVEPDIQGAVKKWGENF